MNINLEIKRKEKQNKSNYLNIIMYFRGRNIEECDHYFECIKQNLNNTFVNNIICLAFPDTFSGEYLHTHPDSRIIVHLLDDENEENYYNLFNYANNYCINEFCAIIRSDIVIDKNEFISFLPAFTQEKSIYAVSSVNKMDDKMWKEKDKMNNFYSLNHDIWLFKSSLDIDLEDMKQYDFNLSQNEGYINKILSQKYNLINDTENIKIFSMKTDKTEQDDRLRINGNTINNEEIYLLPETEILKKISVDQLLEHFNIEPIDIYKLKCRIFTKKI